MGIEQMYNRGDTRLYTPLGDNVMEMYKVSTPVDTSNTDTILRIENSTDPIDTSLLIAVQETKETKTVDETSKNKEDISSLMRYFGTNDKDLIVRASRGALYGTPKNAHIQNNGGLVTPTNSNLT
jgi:hypothetical protein